MRSGIWSGVTMVGRATKAAREEIRNRERVQWIIELLDLVHVRDRPVGELPYGTQKRVELARALAMEPKLLMVDEPSAGMNAFNDRPSNRGWFHAHTIALRYTSHPLPKYIILISQNEMILIFFLIKMLPNSSSCL